MLRPLPTDITWTDILIFKFINMDFIRVTLVEEWDKKGSPSKLRTMPEYLLPISGILSVAPILKNTGTHIIYIIEHYKPKEEFIVGHAEATLPNGFINVIND